MSRRFLFVLASLFAIASCSASPEQPPAAKPEAAVRSTSTYRLVEQITASKLVLSPQPTIYILGETHLGKGQIEVAKIAAKLFREQEIDAVFLEQPDTLQFDFAPYKALKPSADVAIAALQQRMIDDANRPMDYNFGKFQPEFESYRRHGDQERLNSEIARKYGSSALKELDALIGQQNKAIDETNKIYDKSEYLSAFDYLYVMLNLKGINTPFWTVESLQRRTEFKISETADRAEVTKALGPRDEYMAKKIDDLSRQQGYRNTVLVCGALHLPSLPRLLQSKGYAVKVVYNSLEKNAIKKEMAVLVKPDHVLTIARSGTRPEFKPSDAYVVQNGPSQQLMTHFDQFTRDSEAKGLWNADESARLRLRFVKQYQEFSARSKPSWTLDIVAQNGRVIRAARNLSEGSFTMAGLGPIDVADSPDATKTVPGKPLTLILADEGSHFELINPAVSEKAIYQGLSIPAVAKLADEALKGDPSRTVYIDLAGVTPGRLDALVTSLRIQFEQPGKHVSLRAHSDMGNHDKAAASFFAADARIELTPSPAIEQITSGDHMGWYATTLNVVSAAGRASLRIIGRTAEIVRQALAILSELAGSPRFTGTSPASLVSEIRWELKRRHGLSDEDLSLEFKDQFGNIQIVSIATPLSRMA